MTGLIFPKYPTRSSTQGWIDLRYLDQASKALGVSKEASKVIDYIEQGNDWKEYAVGNKKYAPKLQGKRFDDIKERIENIKLNGFTLTDLAGITSQTFFIAKSYLSLIKHVTPVADYFIFQGIILPLCMLYQNKQSLEEQYEKFQNAKNFEESVQHLFQLLGTTAQSIIYVIQIAAAFALFHVGEVPILAISTFVYFTSLYELVFNDHKANREKRIDEIYGAMPTPFLV